ncbi:MAG: site-2 protease family protein [Candidatus Bipolaricaulis sp.]|nr:site-2 protease family protein [Candidatus Bipolaricaulis sp.]
MTVDAVLRVVLSLIALFMAIVLHEVAHGLVAARLGDPTARAKGRLSINPLAHVDPIGTLLVPIALAIFNWLTPGAMLPLIGWAKPVPVNPNYFRNPFRGMLFVAVAGPGTNLVLAGAAAGLGRLLLPTVPNEVLFSSLGFSGYAARAFFFVLGVFITYNLILAVFNLIPIPPLDGSRIVTYFLPPAGRRFMITAERYGFFVLLAVVFLGGIDLVFRWVLPAAGTLLGPRWVTVINLFS